MHDKPPCASASRLRAVLEPSGASGIAFVNEAMPEYLDYLVHQLLDAPTEQEFTRLCNEAVWEYAAMSTPNKRKLLRRVSSVLPPDALADLGRLLNEAPQPGPSHDPARLTAFSPAASSLLLGLGPELAERFIALFEAKTDEDFQQAWHLFNVALENAPGRASAAIERADVRFALAAFHRIVRHGRPTPPQPPSRTTRLETRLALARRCLRGSVLGGAIGLTAPALLATAGALTPVITHAVEQLPPELRGNLRARIEAFWAQLSRLG